MGECSGQGECDRKTGECKCYDGFTGDGCRHSACPNDCSGHGTCEFVSDMQTGTATAAAGRSHIQYSEFVDSDRSLVEGWDSKKSRGCKCDPYYTGNDCSVRICPKGNDPLTKTVRMVAQSRNYYSGIKDLGVAQLEKPEIQTVVLSPTRQAQSGFEYDGIGGHFTLAYTDMYGQTWTTRPIRVKTKVAAKGVIVDSNSYSLIKSDEADFGLFQDHDNIKVEYTVDGTGTNEDGDHALIVKVRENGAGMQALLVEPQIPELAAATANKAISLTLMNQDAGEIGVTRALTELPNQVIPSITVDETITTLVNVFRITFSDVANSGDQASLSCRVDACDTDGCQPRKGAMVAQQTETTLSSQYIAKDFKVIVAAAGLEVGDKFAFASSSHQTSSPTPPGTVKSIAADNSYIILEERSFGSTDQTGGGATVDVKFLNNLNDRDKRVALRKTVTCAANGDCTTDGISNGAGDFACAGGTGCGFAKNDIILLTSQPGAGQSESVNDGLHRVKAMDSGKVTLEGIGKATVAVAGADAAKNGNIVLTRVNTFPCAVLETRKGTSESLECSGRGTCDGSSGQCECFEGYTSDDCSMQTVLV